MNLQQMLEHVVIAARILEDAACAYQSAIEGDRSPVVRKRAKDLLDKAREANSNARFLAASALQRGVAGTVVTTEGERILES